MAAVWILLQAELRRRWRTWLSLALIAGAFAGLVTAAAAGARRTDSAYPRLLTWSKAPDVLVASGFYPAMAPLPRAGIGRLPQAIDVAYLGFGSPVGMNLFAPEDNQVPGRFWWRKILVGRLANPGKADEANISFTLAQARHLSVGDTLRIAGKTERGAPMMFAFHIVGIEAAPSEFPPQVNSGTGDIWATPAFYRAHRVGFQLFPAAVLRLRHGPGDVAAVRRELSRLAGRKFSGNIPLGTQSANTERSIRPQSAALWLLAALLAAIGLLIVGQLLARLTVLEASGYGALRAIGMNQRQLLTVGLCRAALIGAAAAGSALILAVALSPVFPLGLARIAEPHPGIEADWPTLALGAMGAVLVTVGCAWGPAWRATTPTLRTETAPRLPRPHGRPRVPLIAASARSVTAMVGIRLALQSGAGRTALPVRSTIAGAAVGVAALSAAMVFSASLGHLLVTPALYGATWDADVTNTTSDEVTSASHAVDRDPHVTAWSIGYSDAELVVNGIRVGVVAMSQQRGASLMPAPVQGRLPRRPGEIALGARTLAAIGSRVGDTALVSVAGPRRVKVKIVGTAVFPTLSDGLQLGQGAALSVAGIRHVYPSSKLLPRFDTLFVRFRPDIGQKAAIAALSSRVTRAGTFAVQAPALPTDLVNFGQVQDLPFILGAGLGGLALATITHLLLTSVHRRRRDFAILRTLGFTRSQVRRTVAWQASTLTAAALLIGIPPGIVCGRLAWGIFADQLGILPVIDIPSRQLVIMVPIALAAAVAIAALPGESAARPPAAHVLRSE
jgi:FtsX-like permease family